MKILSFSLRNLNSLAGSFSVDLTHHAFHDSGIFLITGPTGSGKSTLLDAIAYAMYAATPRQKSVSRSINEIMSRDFSECSATVIFEHDGVRYAVSTTSKRSEGRYPFAPTKRQLDIISPEGEHRAIALNDTQVNAKIADITGMPNVEAFCRCMLLAQGAFARFLTMDVGSRAALLSTITQTEEYAAIGAAVHEQYRAAEEDYNSLHAEEELSAEERAATEATAEAQRKAKEEASAAIAAAEEGLRWWAEDRELRARHAAALTECAQAEQAQQAFTSSGALSRLAAGLHAAELKPAEQQAARETEQRRKQEAELTATQEQLTALTPILQAAQQEHDTARAAQAKAAPLLAETRRRIEQELRPAEQSLRTACIRQEEAQNHARVMHAQFLDKQHAREEAEEAVRSLCRQQEETEQRLAERRQDETLPDSLADIKALHQAWGLHGAAAQCAQPPAAELARQAATLQEEKRALLGSQEPAFYHKRATMLTALHQTAESIARRQARLHTVTETRTRAEAALKALEAPYARAEEELQACRMHEKTVTELAGLATALDECYRKFCSGEYAVCPCCGATEHTPGARHGIGENELTQAKKLTQGAEKQMARLNAEIQQETRRLTTAATEQANLTDDITAAQHLLAKQLRDLGTETVPEDLAAQINDAGERAQQGEELVRRIQETELRHRAAAAREALHTALHPFTAQLPETREESRAILRTLERRSKEYTALRRAQQSFAPLKEAKDKAAADAREAERKAGEERKAAEARAAELQASCTAQAEALTRDWQGQSADALTKTCRAQEEALQRALTSAQEKLADLRHRETKLSTRRQEQESALRRQRQNEEEARVTFSQQMAEKGFADAEAYHAALLPEAELADLTRRKAELRDTLTAARAKAETLQATLDRHLARQAAAEEEEQLNTRRAEAQATQAAAEEKLVETVAKLQADDAKRESNRRMEAEKKELMEQRERWALLKSILGDSKESFQQYAQAITFDALIASANRHLRQLYPRFILKQTGNLGLSVQDRYLEERETRAVSNLSGGESFIVSLALALGLSGLRNSRVSIDTLFLDEGFGTLDPESLHHVLQALEQLRMDGKLIGIITHVEAMKETFPPDCTLQVEPRGTGGYSTLRAHPAVKAAPKRPAEEEAPKKRGRKAQAEQQEPQTEETAS